MGEVIIKVTANSVEVVVDGGNGPGIPLGILAQIASEKGKAVIDGSAHNEKGTFGQGVPDKMILTGILDAASLKEIINLSERRNVPIHVTMVDEVKTAK